MKRLTTMVALALSTVALAQTATADGKVVRSAREEIAKLQKELAEQRALLLKILELQAERDQQMLRLAQGLSVAPMEPLPVVPPPPAVSAPVATVPAEPRVAEVAAPSRKGATATVTGALKVKNAQGPAYVFVEDVKGPLANGSIEIKQEDKQFSPRVAVVPWGTKVTFPNHDSIFHNVFSVSVGNEFDLGTARKGDPVKSHVMTRPGVVEIFCNMHARMSATVLVTPNNLFTKVGADGTFRLDGVPVGSHKISAWAGGATVATQAVDVTAAGAQVVLQLDTAEPGAHKNKLGQPYGSYGD